MIEQEALEKMIPPTGHRPSKPYLGCVIQLHVTRACDKSCWNCTQNSQLAGPYPEMSLEQFEQACDSLKGFRGVVGLFGGNCAVAKNFFGYCEILRAKFPREQLGIWSNNPIRLDKAREMARTFNPGVSNLNVHLDRRAYDMFKAGWPECNPVGLTGDSRHAPCFVAMKDLDVLPNGRLNTEENRWDIIADCEINQRWSAMIGLFRGQLRAWFCEIAGAQSILHQDEPDYPDTGHFVLTEGDGDQETAVAWWRQPMSLFAAQARKHCHECSVPLRGHGELSQEKEENGREQVSPAHAAAFRPKRSDRAVEVVTGLEQLGVGRLQRITDYLGNAHK